MIYFTRSARGYSHIDCGTVCQDFSANYHDDERTIITCCDGHGGSMYFRSERGSKFASNALINVLKSVELSQLKLLSNPDFIEKIRLQILCDWNAQVETDLAKHPFTEAELSRFDEDRQFTLKLRPEVAYGTTLNAAMIIDKYIVCVRLGDGGVFLLSKGMGIQAFVDDENNVANITSSICQEKAHDYLDIAVFKLRPYDGVVICTDGLLAPYQSYANFQNCFIKPVWRKFSKGNKTNDIVRFINSLAKKKGIGDDVSVGVILKKGLVLDDVLF